MANKTIIIEGEVNTYFDSGTFVEVDGKTLTEILADIGAIELKESFIKPTKGKKKIRLTIEVFD